MLKIDKEKNLKFYKSYMPCDCVDCRNFCKQIKSVCNDLTDFFLRNNIDIEKPFELVSFDLGEEIEYISCQYLIFGECSDDFEMNFSNMKLRKELDGHPSTKGYDEPNFVLDFSITLPKIIKD